jgi:hypothetical protein
MGKIPDPTTPEESTVINAALKHALASIAQARVTVIQIRPSDEYAQALDALDGAQRILEAFIEREG